MKTLIVSATLKESELLISEFCMRKAFENFFVSDKFHVDLLIAGIGIPATIFAMFADAQIANYDFVINVGIAGSFKNSYNLGQIVNVTADRFGDIGLRTKSGFLPVFESQHNSRYRNLLNNGGVYNTSDYPLHFKNIEKSSGVTVNIPEVKLYEDVDVETMEGAAFMLVCKYYRKVFVQIRGISNIIGVTDKNDWDFNLSIRNYTNLIVEFIKR